jgi:hypothetical protein
MKMIKPKYFYIKNKALWTLNKYRFRRETKKCIFGFDPCSYSCKYRFLKDNNIIFFDYEIKDLLDSERDALYEYLKLCKSTLNYAFRSKDYYDDEDETAEIANAVLYLHLHFNFYHSLLHEYNSLKREGKDNDTP